MNSDLLFHFIWTDSLEAYVRRNAGQSADSEQFYYKQNEINNEHTWERESEKNMV